MKYINPWNQRREDSPWVLGEEYGPQFLPKGGLFVTLNAYFLMLQVGKAKFLNSRMTRGYL